MKKEIKKVLVAGRLMKNVSYEKWESKDVGFQMLGDGVLAMGAGGPTKNEPRKIDPKDMPKEVPTEVKGTVSLLKKRGCEVDIAQSYEEAKSFLKKGLYDGVVVDVYLPSSNRNVGRRTTELIGTMTDVSVGMQVSGILLAHELSKKNVWGVILDTCAITEGVLFLLAHGVKPKKNEIEDTLREYEKRTRYSRHGWHWISNCDGCTVAALFGEI